MSKERTRYPWERELGARRLDAGHVRFRVWAPAARTLALRTCGREVRLEPEGYGVFSATVAVGQRDGPPDQPAHGTAAAQACDYWFVVDGRPLPDPATRWQPHGLRGPSRVFVPRAPALLARPPDPERLVIYELHVGTFSAAGTFDGAIPQLPRLAELGVNAIELMPVAEFPGARGWGYDGVYISAPQSSYGGPAALQALIDAAHAHGLAVILDVVYNHVGVSGIDALSAFGPYFTASHGTPWGKAINYDDQRCDPVREWVLQSAEGWVRDYGIDGLRLDAIHAIHDSSPEHIVAAIVRRVHHARAGALVVLESGLNDPKVVRAPAVGGWGADLCWADDFHHALRTLVTDERDGYYAEFGCVELLAKALHRPFVHDGSYSSFRRRRFGAPADDVPPWRFIVFCQNHDQVGNRALGDRLPPRARRLAAFITLLAPFTPMLFMGEEYGERAPFQFFTDHIDPEIAAATRAGRREEFAAFAQFAAEIPDPQSPSTFARSKLTLDADPELAELYARLLRVRRRLPAGDADATCFDEAARWLRVKRGSFELIAHFGSEPARFRLAQSASVLLATHPLAAPADGMIELPPLAGALACAPAR